MDSDNHLDRQPEPAQPARSRGCGPSLTPGVIQCPRCGSTRIRRQTRPLLFNGIACGVTLALTPVLCVMALGVLVSFMALPITTCIAVVGRHRCRDCGHRFPPGHQNAGAADLVGFPWTFHLLNIAVLSLLCVVGPLLMRAKASEGKLPDDMGSVNLLFTLGFLLWGSLVYHLVLYHTLRRRPAHRLIRAILFLLPGVLIGALVFHACSPSVRIRGLLSYAQLAPLPNSATGVRYYSWSSPFSGEDYLRFTAEPNDIERFLADSPALQRQEPQRYSTRRMRLHYPTDAQGRTIFRTDANEYVLPRRGDPPWYQREIKGPARKYHIQPPRDQLPGEVLVDDETHTVYVYLCFS